jgi:hypothetical protein
MSGVRYAWAAPVTALGLLAALLTLWTGGKARRWEGTLEIHGGFARWLLRRVFGAQAMTLGHVILGISPLALAAYREHERAHVRQCEQWGIFFLPAYVLASLWAVLQGGHYYRDNAFEVSAERAATPARPGQGPRELGPQARRR